MEQMRSEFEAWFTRFDTSPEMKNRSLRRSGDSYELMQAHSAWETWQACWHTRVAASEKSRQERDRDINMQIDLEDRAAGRTDPMRRGN